MTSSWMIVAGLMFATMGLFVKMGAEHFEAAELALYRSLISLAFVLGIVAVNKGTVRTAYPGAHVMRGMAGGISLIAYFYAITQLPLATAQTLNYTSPLFLAIGTMVVLGERFSLWLVSAIALGFVGVAVLLQPTFQGGKEGAAMIGLFSGVLSSWAYLSVRTLGKLGEPDWRVLFWFSITASILCVSWQASTSTFHAITWANAWILAAMGTAGTLAQLAMTRAYRTGNTLVVGALSYSTLVFGALLAFAAWNERLAPLEWVGMALIIVSGVLALQYRQ